MSTRGSAPKLNDYPLGYAKGHETAPSGEREPPRSGPADDNAGRVLVCSSRSRVRPVPVMRITPYVALASRALEANFRRPDFPYKLTFCITFWCNYRCQTCNIWQMQPRDELRLDEIQRFFQRSPRFLWVDLTGGEVSLRKDFVQVCEAVITNCKNLVLLHFPTNGYLTDKIVGAAREIVRMGAEKLIITVSTDGDEAMNDEIRGIEGGWRRQIETFRRLREVRGVQAVLGMTLSGANVDHFPQAFAAP